MHQTVDCRYVPRFEAQNNGGETKENEHVFLRKLTLNINRCFLLRSLLEPLMKSTLDANYLGEL